MDYDRLAPYLGAVGCLLLAGVASAPFAIIDEQSQFVASYYAAGPLGLTGVVFLAILGVVIFLSSVRGRADASLVAGIMLVVGPTIFVLSGLWALSLDPSLTERFVVAHPWIAYHSWTTVGLSGLVAAASGLYAAAVY